MYFLKWHGVRHPVPLVTSSDSAIAKFPKIKSYALNTWTHEQRLGGNFEQTNKTFVYLFKVASSLELWKEMKFFSAVSVGNFFWLHCLSANFCINCTPYCVIFSNHFRLIWSQKALCYVKQRCVRAKICTFPMFGNKQVVLPLQSFYALLSQVSKIELYVRFVIFPPPKYCDKLHVKNI